MARRILPRLGPPVFLREFKWTVTRPKQGGFPAGRYLIVLCDRCIKKRNSRITWNKSVYKKYTGEGGPDEWYSLNKIIKFTDKCECYDCKYKYRSDPFLKTGSKWWWWR